MPYIGYTWHTIIIHFYPSVLDMPYNYKVHVIHIMMLIMMFLLPAENSSQRLYMQTLILDLIEILKYYQNIIIIPASKDTLGQQ